MLTALVYGYVAFSPIGAIAELPSTEAINYTPFY